MTNERILPMLTAEQYFKHKEIIEAWLSGAEIEYLDDENKWSITNLPIFHVSNKYRVKILNIKKQVIIGWDGDDLHHTRGVHRGVTNIQDAMKMIYYYHPKMRDKYNKSLSVVELEIDPRSGKVVDAKVIC